MLYFFLSKLPLSVKLSVFQYGRKLFKTTVLPPFTSFSNRSLITIAPRNNATPTAKNNKPINILDTSILINPDIHITTKLSGADGSQLASNRVRCSALLGASCALRWMLCSKCRMFCTYHYSVFNLQTARFVAHRQGRTVNYFLSAWIIGFGNRTHSSEKECAPKIFKIFDVSSNRVITTEVGGGSILCHENGYVDCDSASY